MYDLIRDVVFVGVIIKSLSKTRKRKKDGYEEISA